MYVNCLTKRGEPSTPGLSYSLAMGMVLELGTIDQTQVAVVGGKGAHLGELSRIDGIRVPPGFCVTTDAFRRIMAAAPSIDEQLDRLSRLDADDRDAIRALSAEIRRTIEAIAIPDDVAAAITGALARLGERRRVRRALERDGRGPADGLVRRPAGHVPERRRAGRDPRARQPVLGVAVHRAGRDLPRCATASTTARSSMAVVVQRMVVPHASGVLFTADPVTSQPEGRLRRGRASASARRWSPAW